MLKLLYTAGRPAEELETIASRPTYVIVEHWDKATQRWIACKYTWNGTEYANPVEVTNNAQ